MKNRLLILLILISISTCTFAQSSDSNLNLLLVDSLKAQLYSVYPLSRILVELNVNKQIKNSKTVYGSQFDKGVDFVEYFYDGQNQLIKIKFISDSISGVTKGPEGTENIDSCEIYFKRFGSFYVGQLTDIDNYSIAKSDTGFRILNYLKGQFIKKTNCDSITFFAERAGSISVLNNGDTVDWSSYEYTVPAVIVFDSKLILDKAIIINHSPRGTKYEINYIIIKKIQNSYYYFTINELNYSKFLTSGDVSDNIDKLWISNSANKTEINFKSSTFSILNWASYNYPLSY